MKKSIEKATKALQKNLPVAQKNPYRPRYHFHPPANWMNDPNGTIFHNGEYHLFYQHNPYKPRWGRIHWGHAKSKDLVNWEDLPIALAPESGWKELHCFSGCCVIGPDNRPTIFYTSISTRSFATAARRHSQQWAAHGDPDLIVWKKKPKNPIMDPVMLHPDSNLRNWRDPYIFQDYDTWYMVIAGQFQGESYGSVLLYQSTDLIDWQYVGRLYQGEERLGKTWECPNYFRLGDRYILMVSPFSQVIYTIGEFTGREHRSDTWFTFDHGKNFYATNTFKDDKDRTVIVGWIKVDGKGGWAGCLSLPRELRLDENNQLLISPLTELQGLRHKHQRFERELDPAIVMAGTAPYYGECVEIKAKYNLVAAESVGFQLIDDLGENIISYDFDTQTLSAIDESAKLQFLKNPNQLELHIFIDKSVIEIFINGRETLTSIFYPTLEGFNSLKIVPFFKHAQGKAEINFWALKEINS